MKNSIKLFVIISLFIAVCSCSEKKTVNQEIKEQIIEPPKEEKEYEVVSVKDFNKHPPFFSTLKESSVAWKTVSQKNEINKMFQFNASTIFAVNDEIIKSKIVDDEVIINHGIHTGMTRKTFESHFNNLKKNEIATKNNPIVRLTASEVYFSCCSEETQYWKFLFVNDTLYEVEYFQYYD
jgi:hypothetical protein